MSGTSTVSGASPLSDGIQFKGAYIDTLLSSLLNTVVDAIAATTSSLTLPIKAAMDEATYSNILKSGNNYVINNSGIMADLTTFTKTDPSSEITINSGYKVSVAVGFAGAAASLYKTISPTTDFSLNFEIQINSDNNGANYAFGIGVTAGAGTKYMTAAGWSIYAKYNAANQMYLQGTDGSSDNLNISLGTLYYCTLSRASTTATLTVYSDAARSVVVGAKTLAVLTTAATALQVLAADAVGETATASGFIQNVSGLVGSLNPTTASITSASIIKNANIGLRYWSEIIWNLVAGATGSTIAVKICDSTGTPLHTNFVTIAPGEYARCPLLRPVVLTAGSNGQTVWNFTSLTNANAFINELGVLAEAINIELAKDGTNYTTLLKTTNFTEDITNPLAPQITLVSGTGVVIGVSKLRVNYIVNVALSNTTIKLQVQLNRVAGGDTSPSITPLASDTTKYVQVGQVTLT